MYKADVTCRQSIALSIPSSAVATIENANQLYYLSQRLEQTRWNGN